MMQLNEQSPAVRFLLAASLILTVINLSFVVADRFRKSDLCKKCRKQQK